MHACLSCNMKAQMPAWRITKPARAMYNCARPQLRVASRRHGRVAAASESDPAGFSLAPSTPKTPYGEMMAYYLKMEPGLFRAAVEGQFQRLKQEREQAQASSSEAESEAGAESLALSSLSARIEEVKVAERRATVEDLMYMCILEEFIKLGVGMLPKMDNYTDLEAVNLSPLMEGVHTKEAIDMVKEHMMGLLGQAALLPPTVTMKMSKLQMVQVYAASVMFGYFLRRVDKRYQLAKSLGMLPETKEDAVARLERLFSLAEDADSAEDLDSASSSAASEASTSGQGAGGGERKSSLRQYIEGFDRETMMETATIMSKEGVSLLDRQSKALWGDVQELQKQMQEVLGPDASSMEELMQRAQEAVAEDKVETVTMNLSTQRRAVLEAVAFGTFLRDTETHVQEEYGLLTTLPPSSGPNMGGPGMLPQ